jgi:hypothetical protein
MRHDRSDLPRGLHGGGGVAKVLRDERADTLSAATSNSSSFLYNDAEPFNNTYYVAYCSRAQSSSPPATRSQLMHIHSPSFTRSFDLG